MAREVNISLRGVLEELPAEVAELLGMTLNKISETEHKLSVVIERLADGEDVSHCMVDLESARQSLYKIDNRIGDCMGILGGYIQHMNNPQDATPPQVSDEDTQD